MIHKTNKDKAVVLVLLVMHEPHLHTRETDNDNDDCQWMTSSGQQQQQQQQCAQRPQGLSRGPPISTRLPFPGRSSDTCLPGQHLLGWHLSLPSPGQHSSGNHAQWCQCLSRHPPPPSSHQGKRYKLSGFSLSPARAVQGCLSWPVYTQSRVGRALTPPWSGYMKCYGFLLGVYYLYILSN